MIRCALVTVGSILARAANPESLGFGGKLGGFGSMLAACHWCLKWVLSLWALVELNWVLNRWATNRWSFKTDKSSWDWKREIAVVTGGSAGIGACVVKKLVSHGIKVAVLDVSPLSDVFTQDELALVRLYKCDITSRDDIHQAAEAIRSDWGHPSILINNAGIGNAWTILDIPQERLKSLFDINIISHWSTVQEFLPDMIAKKKGHVMAVASLASFVALAGAVDYSCTKAAVLAFYEGLTMELKHRYKCPQIHTSIVHPDWTKSALTSHEAISSGLKKQRANLLEADHVADAMVNQIIAAESGQLILSCLVNRIVGPAVRCLPSWWQEGIRDSQAYIVTGNGTTGKS